MDDFLFSSFVAVKIFLAFLVSYLLRTAEGLALFHLHGLSLHKYLVCVAAGDIILIMKINIGATNYRNPNLYPARNPRRENNNMKELLQVNTSIPPILNKTHPLSVYIIHAT